MLDVDRPHTKDALRRVLDDRVSEQASASRLADFNAAPSCGRIGRSENDGGVLGPSCYEDATARNAVRARINRPNGLDDSVGREAPMQSYGQMPSSE